jgi:hypothetical protein
MEKETKNLWRLLMSLLTVWILVIYLAALFAFNMLLLPRGYHLMAYAIGTDDLGYMKPLIFRSLSGFIFKHTGDYCDVPFFPDDFDFMNHGVRKDFTINYILVAHSDSKLSDETRDILYAELERALTKCNPNITDTETVIDGNKEVPPIFAAILTRNEKAISLLLKYNVDLNNKLIRPGKKADQMTPVEFARLIETNMKNEQDKEALRRIIALLESHMSSSNVQ